MTATCKNALRILNGKLNEKRRFEDNGVDGEDSIKRNLKEINSNGCQGTGTALYYTSARPYAAVTHKSSSLESDI